MTSADHNTRFLSFQNGFERRESLSGNSVHERLQRKSSGKGEGIVEIPGYAGRLTTA